MAIKKKYTVTLCIPVTIEQRERAHARAKGRGMTLAELIRKWIGKV